MLKRPEAIIPPLTVMAGILVLLVVARNYDRLPVKPPACSFKSLIGIPCFGCGGTRAFKSLSRGDVAGAFQFNPAVTGAVFAIAIWLAVVLLRKDRPHQSLSPVHRRKRTWFFGITGVLIFTTNWIYLILYLP